MAGQPAGRGAATVRILQKISAKKTEAGAILRSDWSYMRGDALAVDGAPGPIGRGEGEKNGAGEPRKNNDKRR